MELISNVNRFFKIVRLLIHIVQKLNYIKSLLHQTILNFVKQNMSHIVTALIDKLRMWYAGKWITYNTNHTKVTNIFLRIYYEQLFIISENKVLETLNLNSKIKGIYKDDVLILINCDSRHQVRKIKFQIKTNIAECFHKLSLHFPVLSYNNSSTFQHQMKYRKVEDVLKIAIKENGAVIGLPLPSNFNDFIKLCLLDPNFPNVIDQIQDTLKKLDI